ncbi:hypothetical protein ACHAXM_000476 [Skeletonema potamos]
MLIILLLLSGAIAATLKFGVPSAQRTINAGNKDDAVEVDPTNSPTLTPVDDVNETFIETPTSFPTVWETYHPSILWPTYSPTLTPSYPTADYDDGGNFSTAIVEDDHLDDNATAATIDDLLVGVTITRLQMIFSSLRASTAWLQMRLMKLLHRRTMNWKPN